MKITADTNVLVRAVVRDDGIMVQQGQWLGAETFVSFDKKAVSLLSRLGQAAQMP